MKEPFVMRSHVKFGRPNPGSFSPMRGEKIEQLPDVLLICLVSQTFTFYPPNQVFLRFEHKFFK